MAGPLKKFKAGAVSCALWENEATVNGKAMKMLRATVERGYKGSDGQWKNTNSFGRNEIPLAIYGLLKAYVAIIEEGNGEDEK